MRSVRWVVAAIVAAVLLATVPLAPGVAAAAEPVAGERSHFPDIKVSGPQDIVVGPDDAMWFTNNFGIGRITTDGVFSFFTESGIAGARGIALGSDGNLWFTSNATIGMITPGGDITLHHHASLHHPHKIASGSDGALWFLDNGEGVYEPSIGRITTDGDLTFFDFPDVGYASDIASGPDGNLWVIDSLQLHRITPTGTITTFVDNFLGFNASIVAGPDGAMWYTAGLDWNDGSINRITVDGVMTSFPDPRLTRPTGLAFGADGALWFAVPTSSAEEPSKLGRMTTGGDFSFWDVPGIHTDFEMVNGPDDAIWWANAGSIDIGRVQVLGLPGPPQQLQATAHESSATLTWQTGPDGGSPITKVTVTSVPGGLTCTWTTGPRTCEISGLDGGTDYAFTATAETATGASPPSELSNLVFPGPGSYFHAVPPTRILDSRTALGSFGGPVSAGMHKDLSVGGEGGVPADATAVVMNVTATRPSQPSYLTLWPALGPKPTSSNLNFSNDQTVANLVTVRLGSTGEVSIANAIGNVHVVADVLGYYDDTPGDRYHAMAPARILDSRTNNGGWDGRLTAAASRTLAITGDGSSGAVPATATAVVANVTVTESTAASFLRVWPSDVTMPTSSTLNFGPYQTVANLTTVGIGSDGRISIATEKGQTHVVVDVVGYYDDAEDGSLFHPIDPVRFLDNRVGNGLTGWFATAPRSVTIAGRAPIPVEADAVVANITATNGTTGSFLTAYPTGTSRPSSSTVNFGQFETVPNHAIVAIGTSHAITIANDRGHVDVVGDAFGYFADY